MAFVESKTTFPDFASSKEFFKTGAGQPPTIDITSSPGVTQPAVQPPSPPPSSPSPPPSPPLSPFGATTPSSPLPPSQPGFKPITLGYETTGGIESRLLNPLETGIQAGEEQLTEFADLFRTQAGPGRTFQGIGGEETLETAITSGDLEPAQGLVGAQYTGPQGFDPGVAGSLMQLTGALKAREQALGTGGGIAETLQQSAPGTTGGEALFTAKDILDPEYRARLAGIGAGIDPFGERLESEVLGTAAFAKERTAQEEAIGEQSREYLGGRREGITGDIQSQMDEALAQQLSTQGAFADIKEAPGFAGQMAGLKAAQEAGIIPPGTDLSQLNTEARDAVEAAPGIRDKILQKYPSVSQYDIGVPGAGKRGKPSPFVRDPRTGELRDYREVIPPELQRAWTQRQRDLEEMFNPLRQAWMESQGETLLQQVSPLYFGGGPADEAFAGGFEGPELAEHLKFDPGVRPSRGNISTQEQRTQFNNINDLLGDLDRISKDENVFRAASIGINIDKYLEAEEAALEEQKGALDAQGHAWQSGVRTLRKRYKKAKKKEEWGKVGAVVGGVLGAVIGSVAGGPQGAVVGTGIGTSVGYSAGTALA